MTDWIALNGTIPGLDPSRPFPDSCCEDVDNCVDEDDAYDEGCEDALTEFLEDNLLVLAAIGISFIVGEVR